MLNSSSTQQNCSIYDSLFPEKIMLGISWELSALRKIHMKCKSYFSDKNLDVVSAFIIGLFKGIMHWYCSQKNRCVKQLLYKRNFLCRIDVSGLKFGYTYLKSSKSKLSYSDEIPFNLRYQELWSHITKTRLYNIDPLKPHFYTVKLGFIGVCIIFSYFCSKK